MLASRGLSSHSETAVVSKAMSENHRKFFGPQWTQYTGTSTPRKSV